MFLGSGGGVGAGVAGICGSGNGMGVGRGAGCKQRSLFGSVGDFSVGSWEYKLEFWFASERSKITIAGGI